jgi:hypothetical protein
MITSQDDYKQKLISNHSSKRALRGEVDANCISCSYHPIDVGSWRKQVENYCGYSCSLYPVRPTTILSNTK